MTMYVERSGAGSPLLVFVHGFGCSHMASQRADLETVFLTLTGRSVRNA